MSVAPRRPTEGVKGELMGDELARGNLVRLFLRRSIELLQGVDDPQGKSAVRLSGLLAEQPLAYFCTLDPVDGLPRCVFIIHCDFKDAIAGEPAVQQILVTLAAFKSRLEVREQDPVRGLLELVKKDLVG